MAAVIRMTRVEEVKETAELQRSPLQVQYVMKTS